MTPPVFEGLLAVQDLDTALDRLAYRRQTLPERRELAEMDDRAADLAARLAGAAARLAEVVNRQVDAEAELAATELRMAEVNKRLYGGTVSASRELQAMAADVESLQARASGLEESILIVMEEREPLDAEVAALEAERAQLERSRRTVEARLAGAEQEITSEAAALGEQRAAAADRVPGDLLATYERLRSKLAGVGAARLVAGSCSGCHLALPATEIDRLKHTAPETVVFCDQCGRILVR